MDEVGGLYYAQARRYDANVGRFVSEDKVRGFIIMPYTLNHYGYCWNDPEDYVDVDGRFLVSATLVAIGVGIFVGALGGATGEVVSQTVDGLKKGESLETSFGNINWEKVGAEAIKGGIVGGVAGSGAGLLVVAGTTGVVEFGNSIIDGGKESLYGNQLDEEMSGNTNTFIQCEVLV